MIGVIGLGIMGAGIVEVFAKAGHEVVGIAESDAAVEQGRRNLATSLSRAVDRGKLAQSDADAVTSRVTWSTDFAQLATCELIVEAAPERIDLKRAIFQQVDAVAKPGAILATNTSSLSVTQIAAATSRPDHVVGMHFFNPAPVQRFVEVITTKHTTENVVDSVVQMARSLGKHPAVVADRPGFIVNTLLLTYINQAMWILDSGEATREQIDFAMREYAKFPMGPLELADLIGLDTCLEVLRTIHADTSRPIHQAAASLEAKVAAGELGRKSGRGYYDYTAGKPTIESSNEAAERQVCEDLLVAYLGNSLDMNTSGYASTEDIDAGMTLGCGLPFGPFEEIQRRGVENVQSARVALAQRTGVDDFVPR